MTRLLAACLIALASTAAAGAQTFPSKTIRIIVPFTPGGSNDVVAREIATGLQASLNRPPWSRTSPAATAPSPVHGEFVNPRTTDWALRSSNPITQANWTALMLREPPRRHRLA